MTAPARPSLRTRDDRRFDLRTTALFFLLLALLLCVLAFVVRTAAHVVEHRPAWAGVLVVLAVAAGLTGRSRWRRFSAARGARRAARALEEAAEKASDSLAAPAPLEADAPTERPGGHEEVFAAPASDIGAYAVAPARMISCAELDPDEFEQAIAELCARDDCTDVEVVGGAGDLGADVVALTADGRRVVIQCKHYGDGNKVGSQDMQRFGGTCFTIHQADIAAVVTTSDFTAPALEYARQCGIVCVNGPDLQAWCEGGGPSPWDRADV
ncbi:restriction endonuclease [Streptomyces sp. NPDC052301]|uniref:restriction endonuclease n=1 Tax=Streptomyces sp. NPDC052301 TaxID=3365687 RepID=UPI0037D41150